MVRLLTYVLPSLLFAVLLNSPKFFESRLVTVEDNPENNGTSFETVDYDVTDLRVDPDYIYYYIHWTRYYLEYDEFNILKWQLLKVC